jgi:hypothetical protein
VTLAHPTATVGPVGGVYPGVGSRSGKMVVEVVEIPDEVDTETVRATFAATAGCTWLGGHERYSFRFAELGPGVIIRE